MGIFRASTADCLHHIGRTVLAVEELRGYRNAITPQREGPKGDDKDTDSPNQVTPTATGAALLTLIRPGATPATEASRAS
jgi:hypothetical protein